MRSCVTSHVAMCLGQSQALGGSSPHRFPLEGSQEPSPTAFSDTRASTSLLWRFPRIDEKDICSQIFPSMSC